LYWQLTEMAVHCDVVAPAAKKDQLRARHRLQKFLLRRGLRSPDYLTEVDHARERISLHRFARLATGAARSSNKSSPPLLASSPASSGVEPYAGRAPEERAAEAFSPAQDRRRWLARSRSSDGADVQGARAGEETAARLFFVTATHTEQQIPETIEVLAEEIARIRAEGELQTESAWARCSSQGLSPTRFARSLHSSTDENTSVLGHPADVSRRPDQVHPGREEIVHVVLRARTARRKP
jgi:hypothetical protein